ncbi:hypothetical protein BY458DRAFT_558682 [Sporodiniella umbellata]|nr:hypothetical protein BY458DRAFT_558682 [Sporodiniella umbellata]
MSKLSGTIQQSSRPTSRSKKGRAKSTDKNSHRHLKKLSSEDNQWVLDGHNVSSKSYECRQSCITASRTIEFAVESHFSKLLDFSDILVLQRRDTARTKILAQCNRNTFKSHLKSAVQSIIQRFVNENITKTRPKIELFSLYEPAVTSSQQDLIEATKYECTVTIAKKSDVLALWYTVECVFERHRKQFSTKETHL